MLGRASQRWKPWRYAPQLARGSPARTSAAHGPHPHLGRAYTRRAALDRRRRKLRKIVSPSASSRRNVEIAASSPPNQRGGRSPSGAARSRQRVVTCSPSRPTEVSESVSGIGTRRTSQGNSADAAQRVVKSTDALGKEASVLQRESAEPDTIQTCKAGIGSRAARAKRGRLARRAYAISGISRLRR